MKFGLPVSVLLATFTLPMLADNYGNLPLAFEQNQGQTDGRVQFLARTGRDTLFLMSTESTLCSGSDAFRTQLIGANRKSRAEASEPQIGRSNYFIGNDVSKWHTAIPHYGRVRFADVYPSIRRVRVYTTNIQPRLHIRPARRLYWRRAKQSGRDRV